MSTGVREGKSLFNNSQALYTMFSEGSMVKGNPDVVNFCDAFPIDGIISSAS
jgi:hypothetical protein